MLCSYMAVEALVRAYSAGYSAVPPFCQPFNKEQPVMGFLIYVYYLSKILDLLDTIFIVFEKRWSQLSFLHVYHHSSMVIVFWMNMNVGYDGDVYWTIFLNSLIHTIMYSYYFVTLHTKDVWWKPMLTVGQMVQFMLMNVQAIYMIVSDCQRYPPKLQYAYLYYVLIMLALFANFYVVSYILKRNDKKDKKAMSNKQDKQE
jgi:hypothetical protein